MAQEKPVLIEQSAKKFKLIQLIGVFITLFGFVPLVLSAVLETPFLSGVAAVLFIAGVIVAIVGSTLAWWHHG